MSPLHGYRVSVDSGTAESGSGRHAGSYGSCLYLGPRGQRCDRPALEGGFCHYHSPEAVALGPWTWVRRLAGILVAMAILWPIVQAFLEELSHWRH